MFLKELAHDPAGYRPTEHQRGVIAKILLANTPQLAYDQIARGLKLNTAAETLARMGFISILDGEASLTDAGNQLALAQALVDEAGEPTEQARSIGSRDYS